MNEKIKRNFDYMFFDDGFGFIVDAEKYTESEARQLYTQEVNRNENVIIGDADIVFVRWKVKLSKEEMEMFDLYEPQGSYITCKENDKGAFPCWRINNE